MKTPKVAGPGFAARETSGGPPPDVWASSTARSVTRWSRCGAVISVDGELDAANAGQLADYVHGCAGYCQWLVLDLRELEFIGTAGFSTLQAINDRCAQTKVYWAMVPGVAVSRLLRVCDPDNRLPQTEQIADIARLPAGR